MLTVSSKIPGARRKPFEDFSVEPPVEYMAGGEPTLRQLITLVVVHETSAYLERQESRRFIRVLTERDISMGDAVGKIDSGGVDSEPVTIDENTAIETALQAFEDGLYFCIVDGEEKRNLDEPVQIKSNSRLIFIRLTMLASG